MSELNRFTADEARAMMPSSTRNTNFDRYMRALYSKIELRAKNGFNTCVIKSLYYPSKMKVVIDTLKEDGFGIEYNCLEDEMIIKW